MYDPGENKQNYQKEQINQRSILWVQETKIYGVCVKKKIKMAFPLSEKQYERRHWKLQHQCRLHGKISKPVMVGQKELCILKG
jgi:hypothetical protein